jgi:CRP-like cAMP-binding protein
MTHPDPVQLAGVPLFAGLSGEQLADLAKHLEVEEFEIGRPPARSGQHGYAFFILAEGKAHAEFDGRVLERLEPGAVFGEMAFFAPDSRRTATVVPDTPIRVYSMFGTAFRVMQQTMPEVAERLEDLVRTRHERDLSMQGEQLPPK